MPEIKKLKCDSPIFHSVCQPVLKWHLHRIESLNHICVQLNLNEKFLNNLVTLLNLCTPQYPHLKNGDCSRSTSQDSCELIHGDSDSSAH